MTPARLGGQIRARSFIAVVLVAAGFSGCGRKTPTVVDIAEAAKAELAKTAKLAADEKEAARRRKWAQPSGPRLAVIPGEGVGAIELGATVGTIERLMDKRCEVLTEELCRYVTRGVDFHLQGGYTTWIHVQRAGRPAGVDFRGEPLEFGFFNGAIPPDLRLGMTPAAIQQYLGPPERIEPVPEPNGAFTVARDYYPGLVVEYDRYTNGRIILGGLRIVKDPLGRPGYQYLPPAPKEGAVAASDASRAPKKQVVR
jgi:hypothetical protein